MDELDENRSLQIKRISKESLVRGFVAHTESIACVLLFLWCLLPAFMSVFDLVMGALGRFPREDQLPEGVRLGKIVYNYALGAYIRTFTVLGILTVVFAVLFVALSWNRIRGKGSLVGRPWFCFLTILLFWAILSTAFALDRQRSFFGGDYHHDGLVSYFFYASVFLCAGMISTERRRRFLLWAFCGVMTWLSVLMLLQETGIYFLRYCFPANHAVVFNNSNHFAYLLCMGVVASAGLFMFDKGEKRAGKPLSLVCFCLLLAALLYNSTFGAYLGALFGLAAACVFRLRRRDKAGWLAFLPALLFVLLSVLNAAGVLSSGRTILSDFARLFPDLSKLMEGDPKGDRAGSGRGILWKQTIQRILARPVFGFGPEGFQGDYALYKGLTTHNEYLQMAGYLGVPALVMYLSALLSLAIRQWKRIKELDPLILAASGAAVAYLVSAFFGNPVFNTLPYFWLFLGLATLGPEGALISPAAAGAADRLLAKTQKKRFLSRIAPFAAALVLVVIGLALWLSRRTECSMETADLQSMRGAETTAALLFRDAPPEEAESYWYDIQQFALIPASEAMPQPYGMGTPRRGNALRPFSEEFGKSYEYDESWDYRNRILRVTVSPDAAGGLSISVDWVEYAPPAGG